ncbi:hypothetical protein CRG98_025568 [Punica granatum]|uniref:Reverse transcriptase/retrotransposon-derived protein RNase H-like domain-containing protein n=1 Tax=Punica granatum TaxID=22663 RepID=A0A2I0JCU5_PUNGR|nr:hypothetical protein CRG98_025568 [Punica granatum]
MGLAKECLRQVNTPLVNFTGNMAKPLGSISLPIVFGNEPHRVNRIVNFLVVDLLLGYNAIIDRSTLNAIRITASTFYLKLNFPTSNGVGEIIPTVRSCYIASLKRKQVKQIMTVELDPRDGTFRPVPVKELEEVEIGPDGKKLKVGTRLALHVQESLLDFLSSNLDCFAWHQGGSKAHGAKNQTLRGGSLKAVKAEVEKLENAGFIHEIMMHLLDAEHTTFYTHNGVYYIRDKCYVFFMALKGAMNFEWTNDCETTFQAIKEHFHSLLALVKPHLGEALHIYLGVSKTAVSSVLACEEGILQQPVYYMRKVILLPEKNYSAIEKWGFSLIVASRKLRPYIIVHTIIVRIDQPLKQVFKCPDPFGRIIKWAVELGQFDLDSAPRTTIKA